MKKRARAFWQNLRDRLTPDPMFHETETQANRLGTLMLLCSGLILVLILILTAVDVFPLSGKLMYSTTIQAIVEIVILLVICKIVKNDAWWLKPLLLIGMVIVYARLDSMLTHKVPILMVLPVVFSSRYFSRKLTIFTSLLTTVIFAFSAVWGATHGLINLNIVTMPEGTEMIATGGFLGDAVINAGAGSDMLIRNTLLYDYFPKWLMFSITSIISCNIARRGRNMVVTQHEKDLKTARIDSELNLATRIQADMLPNTYPAFPGRTEFDIYAVMDPAKEVGGDFYDFFLIDEDHLCMIMADVSGKGVPAALFMMASKIILDHYAMLGHSPAQILAKTNAAICANNKEEMFVTVWLGILEISTGKLTAANAGHEYPVVRQPDGSFELIKDKHGFVIGGMDGVRYKEYEWTLAPGAKLFLYTDGVPEATNAAQELFGTERMLAALNSAANAAPADVLRQVRHAVDDFVQNAEQFDDLTMLCLSYIGAPVQETPTLTVEATDARLPDVLAFVDALLEANGCPLKTQMQIDVSLEELFVNIAHYAYPNGGGQAQIRAAVTATQAEITLIDSGIPYDPLAKPDPDITLGAEERQIGGLGIYMVKKQMDEMAYTYRDGHNVLTFKKHF